MSSSISQQLLQVPLNPPNHPPPPSFFSRFILTKWTFYLLIITIGSFLFHSILAYSSKYYDPAKPCPRFATCNIFIECIEGYKFDDVKQKCQVDMSHQEAARDRFKDTIERLEYQYGDLELENFWNFSYVFDKKTSPRPNISIIELLGNCSTKTEQNFIKHMIREYQAQRYYGFQVSLKGQILPLMPKKSFITRSILSLKHSPYIYLQVLFFIALILAISILIYSRLFSQQRKIYNFLKNEAKKYGEVDINYYSAQVRNKFNKNEPIPSKLWQKVQQIRESESSVRQYESLTSIVWRYQK